LATELIGRIAPTRTEGINLRGVFRFPVERYVEKILPSNDGVAVATTARAVRIDERRVII
jgi:predicted DNA-binding ribbon-helix-helix protein